MRRLLTILLTLTAGVAVAVAIPLTVWALWDQIATLAALLLLPATI